jgi:hypothetical protein
MRHGIDLKTHSQCQRRENKLSLPGRSRIRFRFILENISDTTTALCRAEMVERIGIEPMTSSLQS